MGAPRGGNTHTHNTNSPRRSLPGQRVKGLGQAREREDEFAELMIEALSYADPFALKLVPEGSEMARLAEANDEATRRKIIEDLRKQAKEAKKKIGWN